MPGISILAFLSNTIMTPRGKTENKISLKYHNLSIISPNTSLLQVLVTFDHTVCKHLMKNKEKNDPITHFLSNFGQYHHFCMAKLLTPLQYQ